MERSKIIIIILIATPFLLIIISLLTMKLIDFKPPLTSEERRVAVFVSEKVELPERRQITAVKDLRSPIEIVKVAPPLQDFPLVPLLTIAPPNGERPLELNAERPLELKVSMIVVGERRRMAIVNGLVVNEGDSIGRMRITKIERNRILLTGDREQNVEQRTRWVYLEGIK
ncbi:MAG TPA: hypothetical protein DEP99_01825 [Nitrospiraceae bacterium]|nr:hypothetical protein [Nitrospiraceae bacterium]